MRIFNGVSGAPPSIQNVDAPRREGQPLSPVSAGSDGSGGGGEDALHHRTESAEGGGAVAVADPMDALRSEENRWRVTRSLGGAPGSGSSGQQFELPTDMLHEPISMLIDEVVQQRSRRATTNGESNPLNKPVPRNLIPVGVGEPTPVLTRINEWFKSVVLDQEVNPQNSDIAAAYHSVDVRVHTGGTDWAQLNVSVQTATQALLRVASAAYDHHGPTVAEAFIKKLFDAHGYIAMPKDIRSVVDREWVRMHNLAAVLYTVSRQGPPSDPQLTVSLGDARRDFTNALRAEDLRRAMFRRDSQSGKAPGASIYFAGNALANAAGKRFDDLVQDPSLARLPQYTVLTADEKRATVKRWLDERGLDSQYEFGSVENAMASVLKGAALARGGKLPGDYATPVDLCRAFVELAHDWRHDKGCLIDPRILLGLNLAKTRGVALGGVTVQERLADLRNYVNDVLAEFDGPPRFDRRSAALESLERESGLSAAALTTRLPGTDKSVLETFLEQGAQPSDPDAVITAADGTRISVLAVAKRVDHEESMFLALDHPKAPYFKALARLQLRNEGISLTDVVALEAKTVELAKSDRKAQSDARPSGIRHWLDNTPIVSNVIGFAEGVYKGDLEEIVNAIPVVSNLYNIEEGLRTGDYHRAGMAFVTLIPFVGSLATIADGAWQGDAAEVVGGLEGFALDIFTLGEGHLAKTGNFHKVAARAAVDETKTRPRAARPIPHETLPPTLQVHANQSLTALSDLGVGEDGMALRISPEDTARKPEQKRANPIPIKVVPGLDDALIVDALEHYEVSPTPPTLERKPNGMLWNTATVTPYAELGGKLYRLAKDPWKWTAQRPIWNVVMPGGGCRKAMIHLEYVIDRAKGEGRWEIAKNLPELKGGAREGEISVSAFQERYFARVRDEARVKSKAPILDGALSAEGDALVAAIEKKNDEMKLRLDIDVPELRKNWEKMKTAEEQWESAKRSGDETGKAEAKAKFKEAQKRFIYDLPAVAKKVNELGPIVVGIERTVGEVADSVRPGQKADGKLMRVMSEGEARDIRDSKQLRQGSSSSEQHKWFYTDPDPSKAPVQNKATQYRFEMAVPQAIIDKVLNDASDDPKGTLEPFRRKRGASREDTTALEQHEPAAFGVQQYGLEAFSRLLTTCEWRIVKLIDDTVYARGGPSTSGGKGARGGKGASGGTAARGGPAV